MDLLSRGELQTLMQRREGPCVSIYLPTHVAGLEIKQDPIRLKNLLNQTQTRLVDFGLRAPEARALLEPGFELLPQSEYWSHQSQGLAIFLSPDEFYSYRLPIEFPELALVAACFQLKPLFPLFIGDGRFYLLALAQGGLRLFQGSRHHIAQIELASLPKDLADALRYDEQVAQLQFHTRAPQHGGERDAVFHGQGVGIDDSKDRILRYFQQTDRALQEILHNERAPLVLAGVEYLLPLYDEANSYPHLIAGGVAGNPEGLRPEQLHAQAWRIVEPQFARAEDEARSRYREAAGTGLTTNQLQDVVPAANEGRVDTLFVALGVQRWGRFDVDTRELELHLDPYPQNEDLLNYAAVETYRNGGTVYAVAPDLVPENAEIAALLRY